MARIGSAWQDRRVLITGGTGLVGSWLSARLVELGAEVVCVIRDWIPESGLISNQLQSVRVVRGDIVDVELLSRAINEYEIQTVFHLAAQTIVTIANRNPLSTFESNVRGTWNLLEACRGQSTVEAVVIASSDKAYGDHSQLPYTEDTPLRPRHPYDASKAAADLVAQSYAHTFELPVAITRCGNFFGGGDLNWNRIVPGTIRDVLRGNRPVIRSDGSLIRDYFYVEDGVNAYLTMAAALAERSELRGEAFNFSNENQATVLELTRTILSLMDSELEPEIRDEVQNEIQHQHLSAAKAREMLEWTPTFSLEEGLTRTIEWYRRLLGDSA